VTSTDAREQHRRRKILVTSSSVTHDNAEAPTARRWLSVKDIAADLSISIHTAYKWSARGEPWFPRAIRLRNGDLRVRRDWYEHWLVAMEQGR